MQKSHEVLQLACLVAILAVLVGIAVHLIAVSARGVSPETYRHPVGAPQSPRGAQRFDDGRRPVGAQIDGPIGSDR